LGFQSCQEQQDGNLFLLSLELLQLLVVASQPSFFRL
jgi:hypothetical protein